MEKSKKTIVYSALEVANVCGVVNQTAINWIRNGYLTAFSTPGGQYRVYHDDLVNFMKKRGMRLPKELHETDKKITAGKSFLIVDDDKGLNTVLAQFLEKESPDAMIHEAFDGFEAGTLLADKKPRYVVLDLDLPGVDGFNLCKKIRTSAEFENPYIFVVTALQESDTEKKVKELGANEFFQKPVNLKDLAQIIHTYFDKA